MRYPLIQSPGQRGSLLTQDDIIVNCYPEQLQDGRISLVKRKGVTQHLNPGNVATPRGMWLFNGELVSIFGNKLFHGTTEIGTNSIAGSGPCWAAEYGTDVRYLAISNGTNGYRLSTTWVLDAVSDPDFQVHVHGVAHLDGYLFTLSSNGTVAHSDLRDFLTWDPANVINAESYSDGGVAIARHYNYVVAFGGKSIEFFYDAANPPGGSVLSRVTGAVLTIGCTNARTIAEVKGVQFFVSDAGAVYTLASMVPERISTPSIERIIDAATLTDAYAQCFEVSGHVFYMLTMPTSNVTVAYDVTTKRWWQVTDTNGNYWPYVNAVQDGDNVYFQKADGIIYKLDTNQDAGSDFTVTIRTAFVDFGTSEPKILARVEPTTDIGAGNLSFRYSKDDFGSWSTARTVSLATRPRMLAMGQFRRISLEFSHRHNEAMRFHDVDIEMPLARSNRSRR